MNKKEQQTLKDFYNSKIPDLFYKKKYYNLIILHEEIAGLINQIMHGQKNIQIPTEIITKDELDQIENLSIQNNDILPYYKKLLKVISIIKII